MTCSPLLLKWVCDLGRVPSRPPGLLICKRDKPRWSTPSPVPGTRLAPSAGSLPSATQWMPGQGGPMALTRVLCPVSAVGEPITIPKLEHPTQQDIDLYHAMYTEALVKLFNQHKTKFGLPETEVLEVN